MLNDGYRPFVDITLFGTNGGSITETALLDTGFSGELLITDDLVHALRLEPIGGSSLTTANRTVIKGSEYLVNCEIAGVMVKLSAINFPGGNGSISLGWPVIESLNLLVNNTHRAGKAEKAKDAERTEAVSLHFDFPDELRTPCEQYLLYFAEFLKDAGVSATADLKHDSANAREVLFTVTPADPETALDNIREALSIYLRLPTAPMFTMPTGMPGLIPNTPMEVQKLVYAVQNFQTQLTMANMMIMNQQATIQAQQSAIGNYQQQAALKPFTAEVLEDSARPEKVLGGTMELGKLEKYGVAVNLGEVFRKVRGVLGKK